MSTMQSNNATRLERSVLIQKIRELPDKLEEAVKGLSDAQLDTPYRDGGWTVRQVVHHVADSHMNAFLRFKWILTEDHPTIKTCNQDVWATSAEYKMPLAAPLMLIRGLHERWGVMLDAVTEADWSGTATHPESGEVTLDKMLVTYSNHGEKHCGHIWGLRKKMGW